MDALAELPAVFTYSQARHHGLSDRRLYAFRDSGAVEPLGRGLFRRADTPVDADPDLLEIAYRADLATLCLTTALARHGLTDAIPSRIDVALPRGHRQPQTRAPVAWHSFAADTFTVGRDEFDLTGQLTLGIYNPQRCLIDVFRLRHQEGPDHAHEALRRWLRRTDAQPAQLLSMARTFPGAEPALRAALEILL